MTSKKQRKKQHIDRLVEELNSDNVRSGRAQNMIEHAMFVRATELEERRKISYIQ